MPEMLSYVKYVQKHMRIRPRTFWIEYSFYTIINKAKQKFCLGERPCDLSHINTIEQKAFKKHQSYLNRLEKYPLDKAEYYLRLKEIHGVNTVRGLSKITGEDWSCIARVLKVSTLPDSIKDYLRNNKNNPVAVKLFTLGKLLDVVRQEEEVLQVAKFNEFIHEIEGNCKY